MASVVAITAAIPISERRAHDLGLVRVLRRRGVLRPPRPMGGERDRVAGGADERQDLGRRMNALPPFAAFGDEISRLEVRLPILHADQVGAYNTPGRFLALRCGRRWGKAISIQEVIPTPSGWVTLEHVHAGDQVFDERGKVCTITFVTDIMLGLPANEVEFSDGTIIMACDDHRWLTTTHQERKNTARGYEQGPQIRTTRTIRETLTYGKRRDNNHAIASSRPIECPPIIPILPPYVLGVWLGDGHSNGPRYTKPDVEIAEQVALEGVSVHELKVTDGKCRLWSMAGEQ